MAYQNICNTSKAEDEPGFWLKRGKLFNLAILAMSGLADCRLEDNNRQVGFLRLTPLGAVVSKKLSARLY